ncbi:hypothetical protein FDP41_004906 [Naegleria fowleri]|uniref:CAP-Gly domain-containing protein n=1 Tax=Naegleria fowleri TaxID=5763 RepID=A0A6A5BPR3_NAEFO|nr:uncharacterized protein FDP41_004906 [Naegleria fowleri]KAF0976231.1 hypothetical protein FDP41_004906 [Naegleria fowleri]CAG4712356.1 unnamed protein product [Naegleria fowleri]
MVWLVITHSVLESLRAEKQFDENMSVEELKRKLYPIVGTEPQYMNLQVFSNEKDEQPVLNGLDDSRTLASYGIHRDCMRIHVIDQDPSTKFVGEGEEEVEKYVISEEDYDKREDTFRKWKKKHIDPYVSKTVKPISADEEKYNDVKCIEGITKDSRCELNDSKLRGQVKFVGKVQFAKGYWVGIQLDEPMGTNDGSANNKRYFTCPPKHGIFIRPDMVTIGDFPEENYDLEEF